MSCTRSLERGWTWFVESVVSFRMSRCLSKGSDLGCLVVLSISVQLPLGMYGTMGIFVLVPVSS